MSEQQQQVKRHRGRPPVSASGRTEVVNFTADSDDMDRVREAIGRLGAGASMAGWMRDAIREKLEREQEQQP